METPLKILIVEDEVLIAEHLKDILNELGYNEIEMVHNKLQAIKKLEILKPNLVLLDIRMNEELEGIELAQIINANFKIPFIFITAHSDQEIIKKALNTNPSGYLTKPYKKMDVFAAINLSIKIQMTNTLVFKDSNAIVRININEILYVKSEGNYIDIITTIKKFTIRYTLEWFLENVPNIHFRQVHRSYIINTNKIERSSSKTVTINKFNIPVSRNKKININDIEIIYTSV